MGSKEARNLRKASFLPLILQCLRSWDFVPTDPADDIRHWNVFLCDAITGITFMATAAENPSQR